MDRYLVSGATALLFFQIGWLLSSLGLIDPFHISAERGRSDKQVIGQLIQKRENVKRKGADSIIWEDSNANDTLYRYDSVLTLDNSTAQLNLEGDVKLQIHENTLVMLEPMEQTDSDSLRVRFYRGQLRSRNSGQRLSLGSGEWSVEAKPGTDLSLRALEGSRVELEINKGEVHLANKVSGETQIINDGKKLTLNNQTVEVVQDVNAELQFVAPAASRIYSHEFPLRVPVSWAGPAKHLRLLKPNRVEERVAVTGGHTSLALEPGTYSLALEDEKGFVSSSSTLEIVPAPKIRYLNPLPRDRISLDANYLFSWYAAENVDHYQVHMIESKIGRQFGESSDEILKKESNLPYANVQTARPGEYTWSVYAYDSDGFEIPPFYSLPVYFTPKPLAAPKLHAPEQRLPTSDEGPASESEPSGSTKPGKSEQSPGAKSQTPDQGSHNGSTDKVRAVWIQILEKGFALLIPSAHAEMKKQVSFSWYPVEGADFYIIEISSRADFLNPEVIKKVKGQEFLWSDFKNQVYYWRVAGGTQDGRMGLFSEPEKFDVTTLTTKSAGSTGPSLKFVERPAPVTKLTEPVAPPLPTEALKPATDAIQAKAVTPVEPTEPTATSPKPTFIDIAANFDYWLISQETEDIDQVQFRGMALPSFVFAKSWNTSDKTYVMQFAWHSLEWQPEDLPYQDTFNTEIFDFKFFQEKEGWSFGFALRQLPIIERQAFEAVEPSETLFYGLLVNYQNSLTPSTYWQTQTTLLYGDGYFQVGLENKLDFYVQDREKSALGSRSGLYHGGFLDAFAVTGDKSHKSIFFRSGYAIGYRW